MLIAGGINIEGIGYEPVVRFQPAKGGECEAMDDLVVALGFKQARHLQSGISCAGRLLISVLLLSYDTPPTRCHPKLSARF